MMHLLNYMYDFTEVRQWHKMDNRNTRRSGKIQFEIDVPHLSVHQNSPYFIGVQACNYMPKLLQDIDKKSQFKERSKEWAISYV